MLWLWAALAALVLFAGVRQLMRLRSGLRKRSRPPRVDDDALRRIIETGSLSVHDDEDEESDEEEISRAEREFWDESWEEPEEFQR